MVENKMNSGKQRPRVWCFRVWRSIRNGGILPLVLLAALPAACASSDLEQTAEPGFIGRDQVFTATKPLSTGKSLSGQYIAGRYAQTQRDMKDASAFLEKALALEPDNPELLRRIFVMMLVEGNSKRAVSLARKLVPIRKDSPIANLTLVIEDIRNKKYKAAQQRIKPLPNTGLNIFMLPLIRAWTHVGQDDTDAALKALKPLAKKKGAESLHDLHAALIHEGAGNVPEATKYFLRVLKAQAGGSLRMAKLMGPFFERHGQPEKARALYDNYMKRNPGSRLFEIDYARLDNGEIPKPEVTTAIDGVAEGMFGIASSLRRQNAAETALVIGQLGLYLKPNFPIMRIMVGGIFDSDKRYDISNDVYRGIDSKSSYAWPAKLRIATNLDRLDRTDAAIKMLKALSKQHPDKADALIDLGDILRSRERFAEAVKAYDEAFLRIDQIKPQHWSLYYARGISLEQSKQWPRAEADFLKALEFEPEQPYVLNYLGYSWVDRGQHLTKAQNMIKKAVKLRPNDGYIVDSLGWVYYKLGNYKDAARELERAVELRPHDPVINDHLGDAYWRVGRLTEARFQWQRVLALEAKADLVATVKTKLKRGLVEAAKATNKPDGDGS